MPFSGLSFNELFAADLVQRDIGDLIATLSPKEAPILDWLGDSDRFATGSAADSVKHEFIEDFMLPNYIIASTAVNSATAGTQIQINGLGLALNVGQLLENESAAPEVMQVSSIHGANTISVTRQFTGTTIGSLAAGGQLYVRAPLGVTGADHSGADTRRLGVPKANVLGLFRMELAQSGTADNLATYGNDRWENRKSKALIDILHSLEKEVVRGDWNVTNSFASTTTTRAMRGIRPQITTINSAIAASSFTTNPHLYIGNVWQEMYNRGASSNETWGIFAGPTFYRDLSNLNDTKVQDSNTSELFKRVIRTYSGPFGQAELFLSRVLPATELLIVPRERLRVVPLQGRSFKYEDMAKTGDNRKGLITGEYTLELFHESAMARLRV